MTDSPNPGAGSARPRTTRPSGWRQALLAAAKGLVLVVPTLALAIGMSPTDSAITAKVTNTADTARTRAYYTCLDAIQAFNPNDGRVQAIVGFAGGDGNGVPGAANLVAKDGNASLSLVDTTQTASVGCLSDAAARQQRALTLNGTSSRIDVTGAPSQSHVDGNPQYSDRQAIQVWFRTTTTRGGVLGCLATFASACSGRTMYLGNDGRVMFGVGSSTTIGSPRAYNDGAWHLAIAQLHTSTGMKLWVDGALVAANPGATSSDGMIVYPQWGYTTGSLPSGFANRPTSTYYAGDMQFFALYGSWPASGGLSDAQVLGIYEAARP